jgi:hypothetical protein
MPKPRKEYDTNTFRIPIAYKQGWYHALTLTTRMLDSECEALRRSAGRGNKTSDQIATERALLFSLNALAIVLRTWKPSGKQRKKLIEEVLSGQDQAQDDSSPKVG